MTEANPEAAPEAALGAAADADGTGQETMTEPTLQATLRGLLDQASVDAVFGKPVQHEGTIVIPAAEMLTMIGFGFGSGNQEQINSDRTKGGGAGAGGYILGRPVAAIVVTPHSVHLLPIIDFTKIILAAFAAFGLIGTLFFRLQSAGQRGEVEATQRELRSL